MDAGRAECRRDVVATWVTPDVRARFDRAGWWGGPTWVDLLRQGAEAEPAALAVVDESGSLTRGDLMSAASRVAGYLTARGVERGDVITLMLPNWREFAVVHAAIGLVGGVVNPVLPKLKAQDLQHIMGTARTSFVFAAHEVRGHSPYQEAVAAAGRVGSVKEVVPVRGGENSFEDVLAHPWERDVELSVSRIDPGEWDTVTFTSGTEALPKGVVHVHGSTMFGLRAYVGDVLGLTSADRIFMPSPICHASGLQWGLRAAIYTGAPLILQDRWDPGTAVRLIDEHRCTYTLAATPFVVDLLGAVSADTGSAQSLRYVASGGAAVPRHLVNRVRQGIGAELLTVFGSSETYVTTATRHGSSERELASDGAALDGVQVAVVDPSGAVVPTGSEGEIVTRGPHVFLGYLGDPKLTQRAFRGEWYRFGDLGRLDPDGMLRVTGRIKDIIIRGGENISACEVEEVLSRHPAVDAVAVVGYPDPRLGERCCAVVVSKDPTAVTTASLAEFLREHGVAAFKFPERSEVVDALPMTATGKVRKAELRSLLRSGTL
jgi:acyl-CoA synthetase (AMP-forming)/AMP-acid ligase II